MAYPQDFADNVQAAVNAAASLPASALQDVLDFIGGEHCPGRYLVSGVVIEAVDSLSYPGQCLEALIFDGHRVETSTLYAFWHAIAIRIESIST